MKKNNQMASQIKTLLTPAITTPENVLNREQLLQSILDLNEIGVWEWHITTGVLNWNDYHYQLLGYHPGEVEPSYQLWRDHIHPDDVAEVEHKLMQALKNQTGYEAEFRVVRRDGSQGWQLDKGRGIYDHSGQPIRMIGLTFDITERKKTEDTLQKNEQLLQLVMAGANAGSWNWDLATGKLTWSPETYHLYGIDPSLGEPNFNTWYDTILHPDDRNWIKNYLTQVIEQRLPDIQLEFRIVHPQKGIRWILSLGHLTTNERGEPVRLSGINLDISDHKQIQLTLQETQHKLSLLLKYAPVCAAMFDPQMNYIALSQRWVDVYKLGSIEGVLGRSHYEIFPNIPERWRQIHQQALAGEIIRCNEDRFIMLDGSVQWLRWEVYPWRMNSGEVGGIFIFFEDITDLKQAEITLDQQIRQEYLLADIAQEIRHSLNLNQVLSRTVDRVREFLNTDRVIIFRFRPDWQGDVITESVGEPWTPILFTNIVDPCFSDRYIELYRQGRIGTICDIDQLDSESCYVELLKLFQVKANLVVPLLQGETLWGLLIAHHCASPRQWQPSEIAFIKRLATQVSIAITQSELYEQTRQELSERQRIQTILEESEELFRSLSTAAPIGICQTNADGICLYSNLCWQEMSGLSATDTLGYGWLEGIHPEDRKGAIATWEAYLQGQGEFLPELRLLTPEGKIHWVSVGVAPMQSATGEIIGHVFTYEDITERKQAEEELRASQQQLQAILENSPAAIYLVDPQNQHLLVNRRYAELLDTNVDNLLGKSIYDCWPTEIADSFAANNRQITQGHHVIETEEVVPQLDGLHSYITLKFPLYNEMGQLYAIGGISTDITERKKAEEKIRFQADLIDIVSDAIFVVDLESRVKFWNQGAKRLYGWMSQEVLGEQALNLLNKESLLEDEQAVSWQTTLEQGFWQGELQQKTKSGQPLIIASRWTLMGDEAGQPQSILIVNTDITEKKQLEAQFYRTQRLESIGTLASGIAHDFNNLLTPILAVAQLLPLKLPHLDEQTRELLQMLEDSAKRGASLVKQVLSFSRGTEGKRVFLQVGHLLTEVINIAKRTFPKTIEIATPFQTRQLLIIVADATQIHQLLMNLIVNARDAMPDGGILTLSAENRYLDENYARMNLDAHVGSYVVVSVSDTGIGIPPQLLDQIFDPFFTTKEVGAGTGLGLATVLGIVKNHGGFVKVYSEVGKGSQFQVFLPACEGQQSQVTPEEELPKGNGELILIVDDELSVREITKTSLENYNYRTLTASDGIEALSCYAQHQGEISVVLMDLMMPNLHGLTAIRALEKMNPHLKAIATSGLPTNSQQVLSVNIKSFLLKPYTLKDLLNTLYQVILT